MARKLAELEIDIRAQGYQETRQQVQQLEQDFRGADTAAEKFGSTSDDAGQMGASSFGDFKNELMGAAGNVPLLGSAIGALTSPIGMVTLAVGTLTAGLGSLISQVSELERELRPFAAQALIASDNLQTLGIVANTFGIEGGQGFEQVSDAIMTLNQHMEDAVLIIEQTGEKSGLANEVLLQMGQTIEDYLGLTAEERFRKFADALSQVTSEEERAYYASELMSGAGERLLGIFSMTTEELARAEEQARRYGGVLDGELLTVVKEWNDQTIITSGLMRTLGHEVLEEVLPPLLSLVTTMNDLITMTVDAVDIFKAYNVVLQESSLRWQHFANQLGVVGKLSGFALSLINADFRDLVLAQVDATRETEEFERAQRDMSQTVGDTTLTIGAHTDKVRDMAAAYDDARQKAIEQFHYSMQRVNEQFGRQQAAAEREFNRQRGKTIGDFNERIEEEQEGHIKRIADMALDHQKRMYDLSIRVNDERERDEFNHQERMEDIRQGKLNSQEDAQTRLQDRLTDIDTDFKRKKEDAFDEFGHDQSRFNIFMVELEEERDESIEDARTGHDRRLRDIDTNIVRRETDERERHTEEQTKLLNDYLENEKEEKERHNERMAEADEKHNGRIAKMEEDHNERLAEMRDEFDYRQKLAREGHAQRIEDMYRDFHRRLEQMEKDHQDRLAKIQEEGFAAREGALSKHHTKVEDEVEEHMKAVKKHYDQLVEDMGWDTSGGFPVFTPPDPPSGGGTPPGGHPVNIVNPLPVPVTGIGGPASTGPGGVTVPPTQEDPIPPTGTAPVTESSRAPSSSPIGAPADDLASTVPLPVPPSTAPAPSPQRRKITIDQTTGLLPGEMQALGYGTTPVIESRRQAMDIGSTYGTPIYDDLASTTALPSPIYDLQADAFASTYSPGGTPFVMAAGTSPPDQATGYQGDAVLPSIAQYGRPTGPLAATSSQAIDEFATMYSPGSTPFTMPPTGQAPVTESRGGMATIPTVGSMGRPGGPHPLTTGVTPQYPGMQTSNPWAQASGITTPTNQQAVMDSYNEYISMWEEENSEVGNPLLKNVANRIWGPQQMQVVPGEEFDAIHTPAMLRGVSDASHVATDISGDFFGNQGVYGSGGYFGYGSALNSPADYTDPYMEQGWMFGAKMDPTASVGRYGSEEIQRLQYQHEDMYSDPSLAAAALGFDAIDVPDSDFMVALNKQRLLVDERSVPGGAFWEEIQNMPVEGGKRKSAYVDLLMGHPAYGGNSAYGLPGKGLVGQRQAPPWATASGLPEQPDGGSIYRGDAAIPQVGQLGRPRGGGETTRLPSGPSAGLDFSTQLGGTGQQQTPWSQARGIDLGTATDRLALNIGEHEDLADYRQDLPGEVWSYSGMMSAPLNQYLRSGTVDEIYDDQQELEKMAAIISGEMSPLADDTWLYRGMGGGVDVGLGEYMDQGFMSTSTDPATAAGFGTHPLMQIFAPKGTPSLAYNAGEREVLLPPQTPLSVTEYEENFMGPYQKSPLFDDTRYLSPYDRLIQASVGGAQVPSSRSSGMRSDTFEQVPGTQRSPWSEASGTSGAPWMQASGIDPYLPIDEYSLFHGTSRSQFSPQQANQGHPLFTAQQFGISDFFAQNSARRIEEETGSDWGDIYQDQGKVMQYRSRIPVAEIPSLYDLPNEQSWYNRLEGTSTDWQARDQVVREAADLAGGGIRIPDNTAEMEEHLFNLGYEIPDNLEEIAFTDPNKFLESNYNVWRPGQMEYPQGMEPAGLFGDEDDWQQEEEDEWTPDLSLIHAMSMDEGKSRDEANLIVRQMAQTYNMHAPAWAKSVGVDAEAEGMQGVTGTRRGMHVPSDIDAEMQRDQMRQREWDRNRGFPLGRETEAMLDGGFGFDPSLTGGVPISGFPLGQRGRDSSLLPGPTWQDIVDRELGLDQGFGGVVGGGFGGAPMGVSGDQVRRPVERGEARLPTSDPTVPNYSFSPLTPGINLSRAFSFGGGGGGGTGSGGTGGGPGGLTGIDPFLPGGFMSLALATQTHLPPVLEQLPFVADQARVAGWRLGQDVTGVGQELANIGGAIFPGLGETDSSQQIPFISTQPRMTDWHFGQDIKTGQRPTGEVTPYPGFGVTPMQAQGGQAQGGYWSNLGRTIVTGASNIWDHMTETQDISEFPGDPNLVQKKVRGMEFPDWMMDAGQEVGQFLDRQTGSETSVERDLRTGKVTEMTQEEADALVVQSRAKEIENEKKHTQQKVQIQTTSSDKMLEEMMYSQQQQLTQQDDQHEMELIKIRSNFEFQMNILTEYLNDLENQKEGASEEEREQAEAQAEVIQDIKHEEYEKQQILFTNYANNFLDAQKDSAADAEAVEEDHSSTVRTIKEVSFETQTDLADQFYEDELSMMGYSYSSRKSETEDSEDTIKTTRKDSQDAQTTFADQFYEDEMSMMGYSYGSRKTETKDSEDTIKTTRTESQEEQATSFDEFLDAEMGTFNTYSTNRQTSEGTHQSSVREVKTEEQETNVGQYTGFIDAETFAWVTHQTGQITTEKTHHETMRTTRTEEQPKNLEQLGGFATDEITEQTKGVEGRVSEEGRFYSESMGLIETEGTIVLTRQIDYADQQVEIVRNAISDVRNELNSTNGALADARRQLGQAQSATKKAREEANRAREDLASTATPEDNSGGGGGGGGGPRGGGGTAFMRHKGGYIPKGRGETLTLLDEDELAVPLRDFPSVVGKMPRLVEEIAKEALRNYKSPQSIIRYDENVSQLSRLREMQGSGTIGSTGGALEVNVNLKISGDGKSAGLGSEKARGELRWTIANSVREALENEQRRGYRINR